MLLNEVSGAADDAGIENGFAVGGIKRGNGHAPRALAADAPVGPGLNSALNAVLAPGRHPVDGIDRAECGLAKAIVVDVDEPLVHAAENDGRLAAPAVWVAVRVFLEMHEPRFFAQQLDDRVVRLAASVLL